MTQLIALVGTGVALAIFFAVTLWLHYQVGAHELLAGAVGIALAVLVMRRVAKVLNWLEG